MGKNDIIIGTTDKMVKVKVDGKSEIKRINKTSIETNMDPPIKERWKVWLRSYTKYMERLHSKNVRSCRCNTLIERNMD